MISDTLFELAFAYKKTKLWKQLWDSEIFAVRFPDGETGYCSVMGAAGDHCALGLYVGVEGLRSLYTILYTFLPGPGLAPEEDYYELMLSQDCIQCAFESKDELTEEEAGQTRDYARRHGIQLRGRSAFPHFVKYRPYHLPWFLEDERDRQYLCEALAAAIAVAERLEKESKECIGLKTMLDGPASIPLLERRDGAFVWSRTELPQLPQEQYPRPRFVNDISAAKVKRLKKAGIWECRILRFPEPMQEDPGQAPCFPMLMMVVSGTTGAALTPQLSQTYDEEPEDLVEKFAELLIGCGSRPAVLSVSDERTRVLLEEFCTRAGIRVRMCEDLPFLDDALDSLMSHLGIDQPSADSLADLLDMLLQVDNGELEALPDEVREQFAVLLEQEDLPDELTERLAGKLGLELGPKPDLPRTASERSYIISVSVGTGCYRHIRISGGAALEELHEAIQDAFSFDNDHAYAFFMDNRCWSQWDAYFAPGMEEDGSRSTADFCLDQLDLSVGKKFKYVFDFGDEWTFQCRVLRILDEKTDRPAIVRAQGSPPEQYGSF